MEDVQKQPTFGEVISEPDVCVQPPHPDENTQTQPSVCMPYPCGPTPLPSYPCGPTPLPSYPCGPTPLPSYPCGPTPLPSYPPAPGDCNPGNPAPPPYPLTVTDGLTPPIPTPVENTGIENPEAGTFLAASSFDDNTVRRAFIRKVFSVVTLQLLFTFSVVCVFTFSVTVRTAVQKNIWIYISSYIVFVVVAMCLSLCSTFSRSYPWNLIGLSLVTVSLSYMVGAVASFHNTAAVVVAMAATLAISFTIIIFSSQTRVDLTICNGVLLILAVDLLMFGFFSIFYYSQALQILYGCLGALVYALFLAVDCQLVMGREKYGLSAEEYVFAALIIYLDIITIFLYILILLGGSSNN